MADTRHKNGKWVIHNNGDGTVPTADAHLAVLMDIRDELQSMNAVLHCSNFLAIPRKLEAIRLNTKKRKARRL